MEKERVKLERYTIHELRQLGRRYGVKAPAARSKGDLIEQILLILTGDIKPVVTKRGRPIKARDIERWTDVNTHVVLAPVELSDVRIEFDDPARVEYKKGIVRILEDGNAAVIGSGYRVYGTKTFIRADQVKEYALLSGDEIEYGCMYDEARDIEVAVEIKNVNGINPEKLFMRKSFSSLPVEFAKDAFPLSGGDLLESVNLASPIAHGTRAAFIFEDRSNLDRVLYSVVKALQGQTVFPVFLSLAAEEVTFIENNDYGDIYTKYSDEGAECVDAVRFACDRCKRLAEVGKKPILIFDLEKYIRAYGSDINGAVEAAKSILGLGRNLSGGGAVTVLAFMTEGTEKQFSDLFTNMIYIGRRSKTCDFNRSYAKYLSYCKSEKEQREIQNKIKAMTEKYGLNQ